MSGIKCIMVMVMAMMRVMSVIVFGMSGVCIRCKWNTGCHGQRAQQQQAWNELHFRRLGYVL